jgi:hypothetical protein
METMAFIFAFGIDSWGQNLMTMKKHLIKFKKEKKAVNSIFISPDTEAN